METDVKLTKLASCAGCGAKVGAGTLSRMLEGFRTHSDPRLLVGYDKSDDASVYKITDDVAIVQTTDFFPADRRRSVSLRQIAATNALSDVYAMGGEPKLALNIMCLADKMDDHTVREILRGGYDKAYEAGAIITGGHTIHGAEPIYGLAVTGFVHPEKVLTNANAKPGDALILTKPARRRHHHDGGEGRAGGGGAAAKALPPDGDAQQDRAGYHAALPRPQLHGCDGLFAHGPQL